MVGWREPPQEELLKVNLQNSRRYWCLIEVKHRGQLTGFAGLTKGTIDLQTSETPIYSVRYLASGADASFQLG